MEQVRAEITADFSDCFRTLHGCELRFLVLSEHPQPQICAIFAGAPPWIDNSRRQRPLSPPPKGLVLRLHARLVLLYCVLCSCVACVCPATVCLELNVNA